MKTFYLKSATQVGEYENYRIAVYDASVYCCHHSAIENNALYINPDEYEGKTDALDAAQIVSTVARCFGRERDVSVVFIVERDVSDVQI
jgi:hypothetical protein